MKLSILNISGFTNNFIAASLRVTVEASDTVIGISLYIRMLIVHVGFVVFMAVDTTE